MAYNMNSPYYPGQYSGQGIAYPTMSQQPIQQSQQQQPGYTVRPVASREEAVAAQTEFLGLGTIMPDFAHGVIYFKRFNQNNGTTELFDFRISEPEKQPRYATVEELEALRAELTAKKSVRRKEDNAE